MCEKSRMKTENKKGVARSIVRMIDRAEDMVIVLISVLCLLIGGYSLIDSYLVYQHANDDSILKYKPVGDSYQRLGADMVAWLTVEGTKIDEPVMQGKDNVEYLNKDPWGDYSMSGSIFLDSRNSSDFGDAYSLIYGHQMEQEAMFGPLAHYLEKDYIKKHSKGELIVGEKTYEIRFFAAMTVEATQEYVFAPTEYAAEDVLAYVKKHADVYREAEAPQEEEKRLLALSTCKYPDSVDRIVVFGRLISE